MRISNDFCMIKIQDKIIGERKVHGTGEAKYTKKKVKKK